MSWTVTKIVMGLRNLTPSEKAVANVLAYHATPDGSNAYPSMSTIAAEAGLKHRQSAQRIMARLEKKGVIEAYTKKKGGRSCPTRYRFLPEKCNSELQITGEESATGEAESATGDPLKCNPGSTKVQPYGCTKGPEGTRKEEKKSSNVSSLLPSEGRSKPTPTPSQEEVNELCAELHQIGTNANQSHPGFHGKNRVEVGKLLSTYTADELREAYAAFVKHRDDFAIQHAPKHFVEGGVHDVITPLRKRKRDRKMLEEKWRQAKIGQHRTEVIRAMLEEQEELGKHEPPDSPIRQRYDLAGRIEGASPLSRRDERAALVKLRDEAARQPEFQAALKARLDEEKFDPGSCGGTDDIILQREVEFADAFV